MLIVHLHHDHASIHSILPQPSQHLLSPTCHELHAPDPLSGRNGVIIGHMTKTGDGTACGFEQLDLGSIQFAAAAPCRQSRRRSSLTRHCNLLEVQDALLLRSANDPAPPEPTQFICTLCRIISAGIFASCISTTKKPVLLIAA